VAQAYDLYQPGRSWLHRLDPRTKLALVACVSVVAVTTRNAWLMAMMVLVAQAALWSARASVDRQAWAWRMTLPTMLMVQVLWVLLYPAEERVFLSFWFVRLGADNLAAGLAVALRLGALALSIFVWLFTTDQATLVRAFVALGLPYEWGLIVVMALRYLPTMSLAYRTVSEAQQARALDLSTGGILRRARNLVPVLVAMIIHALRTAENLSRALEARALGAAPRRTYLRQLHFGRGDLVWTIAAMALTVAYLWARYALGLGAHALRLLP
jgi:energy-coupling factor transport system permease protein